jgi:glyoxylase-like metal-dependent hydrolase (beta-lactamase superfamily II)
MAPRWHEVADRILARRYSDFNLSIGLVLGEGETLVIDTRGSERQGRELMDEIGRVVQTPLRVVNTHHHFDHCFGNQAFVPAETWAHERCAARLRDDARAVRLALAEAMPEVTLEYTETRIAVPNRTFDDTVTLDVGGREVQLSHLGRGHTDNDVVVIVPDVHAIFAGDLVEQGGPPSFEDSYPMEWPQTLARLVEIADGPVVPGHGNVVSREFVEGQMAELTALAGLARRVRADGGSVDDAVPLAPFPPDVARQALRRALAQLAGELP